jgi:hypothetical protein
LQRSIGNQATRRLINSAYIQTKLQISTPQDPLEQEADRTADSVMRMPQSDAGAHLQRVPVTPAAKQEDDEKGEEANIVAPKAKSHSIPLAVRDDDEEDALVPVQRVFADGQEGKTAQRTCADCEEEQQVSRAATVNSAAKTTNKQNQSANTVSANISALKAGGSPLSPTMRAFFEPRFGADFSQVRLHTDSSAANTARALDAKAFTVENNIAFSEGEFDPESSEGRKLVAHELTHTIQQGATNKLPENSGGDSKAGSVATLTSAPKSSLEIKPNRASISRLPSEEPVSAREYFDKHFIPEALTGVILAQVRPEIHGTGSPWLSWTSGGEWELTGIVMLDIRASGPSWQYMHATLGENPENVINAGRSTDQYGSGRPDNDFFVYEEFARRYVKVINNSIRRLGPKVAWEWNRVVRIAGGPEPQVTSTDPALHLPDPENIIPSHPIDRVVARGMCSGLLEFDAEGYHAAYPTESGLGGPKQLRRGVYFEFERGGGSWMMLRVEDPIDATPEEVALELYGDEAYAHLLTKAGRFYAFQFPPSGMLSAQYHDFWKQKVLDDGGSPVDVVQAFNNARDAAREMIESGNDQAILAQANKLPPTGADRTAIVQRMDVMISIVESMDTKADTFGMAGWLSTIHDRLVERRAACDADDAAAANWDAQSEEQLAILGGCATGFSQAWDNATVTFGQTNFAGQVEGVGDVSQYLDKALKEIAFAYMSAAQVSELVDVGRERLHEAQERHIQYPADVMQATLLYVHDVLDALKSDTGYGYIDPGPSHIDTFQAGYPLIMEQISLSSYIRTLRDALVNDPASAAKMLPDLQKRLELLVFKATTGAALHTFDEMIKALKETFKKDPSKAYEKERPIEEVQNKWLGMAGLITRLNADDPDAVTAVRNKLAELQRDTDFQKLISYVVETIEDEQRRKRWIGIALLIGIIIITVATGGLAGAAVGGWGGVIVGGIVEGIVFTTLSTLAFKDEFNGKDFMVELGINIVMFGGLRAIGRIFQIAGMGAKLTLGARVAKFALENIVMDAAMLTQAEYQKQRAKGKDLTAAEVGDVLLLNLVLTTASSVIARIGGSVLQKFRQLKQLKALQQAIEAQDRALQLANQAKAAREPIQAREAGKTMLLADRVAIEAEPKAVDELATAAQKGQIKVSADDLKLLEELKTDNVQIKEQRQVADLMLRLEQKGPNDFIASPEDYATLRDTHAKLNPEFPPVEQGNQMVITPKPTEGVPSEPITIHKREGTQPTGIEPPQPVAPHTTNEALALRDWKRIKEARPKFSVTQEEFLARYREGEFWNFETGKWRSRRVQAEQDWKRLQKERPNWKGEPFEKFVERYQKAGDYWNFETGAWRSRLARMAPDPVYFPTDVSGPEALDMVMKSSAGDEGSFQAYYDMLIKYEIAPREQIIKAVEQLNPGQGKVAVDGIPQGKTVDFVRHELKMRYREQVLSYILDRTKLEIQYPDPRWTGTATEQAAVRAEVSHGRMLDITKGLNSKDASRISEIWYERAYASELKGAIKQPGITADPALGTSSRQPDLLVPLETGKPNEWMSKDVKKGETATIDRKQLADNLKWVAKPGGTKVMIKGEERIIVRHEVSFQHPKLMQAEAKSMYKLVSANPNLQIEMFNVKGEKQVVTFATKDLLLEPALSTWLGLPPIP